MNERRILLVSTSRAERGLLEPIMIELEARSDVIAEWFDINELMSTMNEPDIITPLLLFKEALSTMKPDVVVVPCDRWEMVYFAAMAFHDNRVVAHFHAGNNAANHPDDMNRRAISCFSHIMFCNTKEHRQNLKYQGEEPWRIHVVGSTILDHIEIDESLCPKEPYDLVILHPDPTSLENTASDMERTAEVALPSQRKVMWLYPNHDRNFELIENLLNAWASRVLKLPNLELYRNLPRPQFLGLLKNCSRAVGNSSSFLYEMPTLNPKAEVIIVGNRNKGLAPVKDIKLDASKRIAEILATIPITDELKRKKLIC